MAEVREKNIVCTGASEMGRTYTSIVGHAVRISAGLIVMGRHGRHDLSHLLLGDVAENCQARERSRRWVFVTGGLSTRI